ncbi:MAG TPA: nitroreductase family deazaflavin-dependent oxidoreductase [Actinomycetota bacterium]|nr:nitroreductase family deazaflavin-dependent oxidoreductase [Actinomycetota bacterium]
MNEVGDRMWSFWNVLVGVHVSAYRATRGLIGHHVIGAPPMLLLDHVGAKTGTKRTTALAYLKHGDDLVVVASKGGHPHHPAWYHNLRAHPDTMVQVGAERRAVTARMASSEERAELWPRVVDVYGGFAGYQRRTDREIPLVILERRIAAT